MDRPRNQITPTTNPAVTPTAAINHNKTTSRLPRELSARGRGRGEGGIASGNANEPSYRVWWAAKALTKGKRCHLASNFSAHPRSNSAGCPKHVSQVRNIANHIGAAANTTTNGGQNRYVQVYFQTGSYLGAGEASDHLSLERAQECRRRPVGHQNLLCRPGQGIDRVHACLRVRSDGQGRVEGVEVLRRLCVPHLKKKTQKHANAKTNTKKKRQQKQARRSMLLFDPDKKLFIACSSIRHKGVPINPVVQHVPAGWQGVTTTISRHMPVQYHNCCVYTIERLNRAHSRHCMTVKHENKNKKMQKLPAHARCRPSPLAVPTPTDQSPLPPSPLPSTRYQQSMETQRKRSRNGPTRVRRREKMGVAQPSHTIRPHSVWTYLNRAIC